MNLLQQLTAASATPAPAKSRPQNWVHATQRARLLHTEYAVARYREVMQGRGWLRQSQIEGALGYASTVSTEFLKKLLNELKLIERRNRDGAVKYARRSGYEWRWIDGA